MATIVEKNDDNLINDQILGKKEVENCRCLELEERSLKAKARCIELESMIQKRNKEFEALESKFKQLESEKCEIENELKSLRQSKPTLENVVDLTGVNEYHIFELKMENRALEYEKKMAETEVEIWKGKFEKLLAVIRKLHEMGALGDGEWKWDESVKSGLAFTGIEFPKMPGEKGTEYPVLPQGSDSPCNVTPGKDDALGKSRCTIFQCAASSRGRVRKRLSYDNGKPTSTATIDICDSDEETGNAAICDSTKNKFGPDPGSKEQSSSRNILEERTGENYEDEDVGACEDNITPLPAYKRKRVISSDSESDDDDDIPICKLKRLKTPYQEMSELKSRHEVCTPTQDENATGRHTRQRPLLLRRCKQTVNEERFAPSRANTAERLQGIPTTDDVQDDESEEGSESESESLNGFIVDDSNESAVNESDESTGDERSYSNAQDESDEHIDYGDIMSRLRRAKNPGKSTWEYEGDMLADFGKYPELCMRAVCVLYRNQTADEKASKSSHYYNQRGFSKFDAVRGTRLGEFLTDGDPNGDLKKTLEELRSFDAEAIEQCRVLATRYSKQLFQIYQNKEDPFFTPP